MGPLLQAARRHRTSGPDCTSVRLHGGTAVRPHGGTATQHGARPHSGSARLYVCTAARPCGYTARTAGARPTRRSPLESSPRRRQRPAAVHTPPRPLSRPRARTAAARPAAVRTHASASPRPLSWVSQHGPRGAQPAYTRCWTASGTAASAVAPSAVPARRGAEKTAQPARSARTVGHRSAVFRLQWIGCDYSRAHSAPDVPAQSRRDSTISPRGEVGSGCALPAR